MADVLAPLLSNETWVLVFSVCFFFGLLFLGMVILGGIGSEDDGLDADHDGFETDLDTDIHADLGVDAHVDTDFDTGDGGIGHHFDAHVDADLDTNVDVGTDAEVDMGVDSDDLHTPEKISHGIWDKAQIPEKQDEYELESKYKLGNFATFSLFFGALGLLLAPISDLEIGIAFFSGVAASRGFGFLIGSIAKNTNNPLQKISYGDPAKVLYGLSYKKSSIANVTRKDGIVVPVMARGARPSDIFEKGEIGFVVGRDSDGHYLISKTA